MVVGAQNLGLRKIIPTSKNIAGRRGENVMRTIKLICRCRMLLIKATSSTATACNSKIINIEMDPPASLFVSVTAPPPIFSPAGNCMFKVNNRNTRTRCEICSKLTIKRRSGVFIVNFEHKSHLALVFLLLTLSK